PRRRRAGARGLASGAAVSDQGTESGDRQKVLGRPPTTYTRRVISLLDIVGPVMVGPSSSHTAGACRLTRVARDLLEEEPVEARFELHAAFAKTMRGHGTDRALVAGALGMEGDDERVKDALDLARERGLGFSFKPKNMGPEAHPNSVAIHLDGKTRRISILGASVGGGMIEIREVDGFPVSL